MHARTVEKPVVLFTFAIAEEVIDIEMKGFRVVTVITGVGKAQAAHMLTKAIIEWHPCAVFNIGTAGTQQRHVGDICLSRHYIDRDFQRIPLPGISYEIISKQPFPMMLLPWISLLERKVAFNKTIINTGDDFVTESELLSGDVIDMEGYALALVCREMNIPILSVKYITDVVGENSVEIWENKLAHAREALTQLFYSLNNEQDYH